MDKWINISCYLLVYPSSKGVLQNTYFVNEFARHGSTRTNEFNVIDSEGKSNAKTKGEKCTGEVDMVYARETTMQRQRCGGKA